ncbi:MAG: choice-of-anchor B family protein [Nocardioidaceae bacterium]
MKRLLLLPLLALLCGAIFFGVPTVGSAEDQVGKNQDAPPTDFDAAFPTSSDAPNTSAQPCVEGMAGHFPCKNTVLMSFLPMAEIGGGRGSDVWGWTDPETDRRYVIAGRDNGTAFVDVTNAVKPIYLGNLPTSGTQNVIWRDIKVHKDHAFIVSEAREHGMQVFDLRQLRDLDRSAEPRTFEATAHYTDFGRAHNLAINEDAGFAYAVGVREDTHSCQSGLHIVDIDDPANPTFDSCFGDDGYTHDAECVNYQGPDDRYDGREICFNSNEDTLTIVDVTDKAAPVMLSRTPYVGSAYSHQAWLTDDSETLLMGDELDEMRNGQKTSTLIWDVTDLESPELTSRFFHETTAIDHNLYIKGDRVYESNYRAGLRVFSLDDVKEGTLKEVSFFDVWPQDDEAAFSHGTWSNYPFFDNGVVAVHGYEGLFLVRPTG